MRTEMLDDAAVAKLLGIRRQHVHDLRADHSGDFPRARRTETGELCWSSSELALWRDRHEAIPQGVRSRPVPRNRLFGPWAAVPPTVGIAAAMVVTLLFYQQRVDQHVTNVDDYLYANQTSAYLTSFGQGLRSIVRSWEHYSANSPLVPTLATPIAAFDKTPSTLVGIQLPLVLLLLLATAGLLRRTGIAGGWRWLLAGLVVVLPPVLTYSAMLNFSMAATLLGVAGLTAYFASDRLRSRRHSVGLGVVLGLLSLSRVVALVYLAALLVPFLIDLWIDKEGVEERTRNAGVTVVVAVAIAAPWWLTAGPSAMHYLLTAGYGDSQFTVHQSHATTLLDRFTRTADETGWLLSGFLAGLFLLGLVGVVKRLHDDGKDEQGRSAALTASVVVLGLLLLGTSSNSGTAFALPYVVLIAAVGFGGVSMLLAGRGLRFVRWSLGAAAATGLGISVWAVFLTSAPHTVNGRQLWLSGTPARAQFLQALGCSSCLIPDAGLVNKRVYAVIGTEPTLILRDDALVNPESLRFLGNVHDAPAALTAPAGATPAPSELATTHFVIAGTTAAPYLGVDLAGADAVLTKAGFHRVLLQQLSAANAVEVWAAS